LRIPYPVSPE